MVIGLVSNPTRKVQKTGHQEEGVEAKEEEVKL